MTESREHQVEAILHTYLQARDRGETPDLQALLDAHPDLRDELAEYFADASKLDKLAESLKTASFGGGASIASPALGTIRYFGDYELLDEIARGGMGVVFKAKQVSLNREVALKMILKGEFASEADVRRFRQEAEAAANLDHPNIVPIYEVGEHEGQQYFSMKLIETQASAGRESGESLRDSARRLAKVARAVHHAHQRGILHRDLKPGNILIDQDGEPHVADFGLAKKVEGAAEATRSGAVVGTPAYMAPEQARAEKALTTAVDVYSLGAILYEWLTGQPPFKAQTTLDTLKQVVEQEPTRLSAINPMIDRDLETICLTCLSKDPSRRYASAQELADDLDRWQKGEPIAARPVGRLERTIKWVRRRPVAAALVIVSCLAVVSLLTMALSFSAVLLERNRELAKSSQKIKEQRDDALLAEKRTTELLNLVRRPTMTAQLHRVAAVVQRFPDQAKKLLHDERFCPVDLRDFTWHLYDRACKRDITQLVGHKDSVTSVAFSRNGKLLASGSGSEFAELKIQTGDIRLWDVASRKQLAVLKRPDLDVVKLAFADNDKVLVSGSRNGDVTFWNVADREVIRSINVKEELNTKKSLSSLALSADGTTLALVLGDYSRLEPEKQQVVLWYSDADKKPVVLAGLPSRIASLDFSRDGKLLATVSDDSFVNIRFTIWEASTGKIHKEIEVERDLFSAAFTPDGKHLAGSTGESIVFWNVETWKQEKMIPAEGVETELAFSADGQVLTTLGMQGEVGVYSIPRAQQLRAFRANNAWCLAFHPAGNLIATDAGPQINLQAATTSISEKFPREQPGPPIFDVGFSNSAPLAFGVDLLNTGLGVWNLQTGEPQLSLPFSLSFGQTNVGPVFSPDGKLIAICAHKPDTQGPDFELSHIELWDIKTKKRRHVLKGFNSLVWLAWSEDGKTLATGTRKTFGEHAGVVYLWDTLTGQLRQKLETGAGSIVAMTFSPDGERLAVLFGSRRVGEKVQVKGLRPEAIKFTSSTKIIPGGMKIWRIVDGKLLLQLGEETKAGSAIRFSPDGKSFALGFGNGMIQLRDATNGTIIRTLNSPNGITCLAFSPDRNTLFSGTRGSQTNPAALRVWDVISGMEQAAFPGNVDRLVLSKDGHALATLENLRVKLYQATPP